MKISVITICKNEVESIEKTLLSVFSQTYKNYEVIVIDGVSTDGTLDIIKKYEDKITHFVSEKDSGIYSAMNKGIALATGDLLYFLNANDSVVSGDIFEKVIAAFNLNPSTQLLFGDFNYIKNGKFQQKNDFLKNYNDYWLFKKGSLCHQTVFYRKELFEKYGKYDEKFVIAGDTDRNANFLIKNRVKGLYLPVTIANYSLGGISGDLKNLKKCNSEEKKIRRRYYGIFSCLVKKSSDYIKFFFPKFFLKINAKHNIEKMNVKIMNSKSLELTSKTELKQEVLL